jgi:hypothetical protein
MDTHNSGLASKIKTHSPAAHWLFSPNLASKKFFRLASVSDWIIQSNQYKWSPAHLSCATSQFLTLCSALPIKTNLSWQAYVVSYAGQNESEVTEIYSDVVIFERMSKLCICFAFFFFGGRNGWLIVYVYKILHCGKKFPNFPKLQHFIRIFTNFQRLAKGQPFPPNL